MTTMALINKTFHMSNGLNKQRLCPRSNITVLGLSNAFDTDDCFLRMNKLYPKALIDRNYPFGRQMFLKH